MSMTRQDITNHLRDILGEYFGTEGDSNRGGRNKVISQAADEIARLTHCWTTSVNVPIQANRAQYDAPQLLEIERCRVYTADGGGHTLRPSTLATMDDWSGNWSDQSSQSQPFTFVTDGLNKIILHPAPNWNSLVYSYLDLVLVSGVDSNGNAVSTLQSNGRPFVNAQSPAGDVGLWVNITGGLGFTAGWYQVASVAGGVATLNELAGTAGSVAGIGTLTSGGLWLSGPACPADTWPNMTDACPLPDRVHWSVVLKAASMRMLRVPAKEWTQGFILKKRDIESELRTELGNLEAETHGWTTATREPANIGNDNFEYSSYSPLNM